MARIKPASFIKPPNRPGVQVPTVNEQAPNPAPKSESVVREFNPEIGLSRDVPVHFRNSSDFVIYSMSWHDANPRSGRRPTDAEVYAFYCASMKALKDKNRDYEKQSSVSSTTQKPIPQEKSVAFAEKGDVRLKDISNEDLLAEVVRRNLTPAFVSASNASREQDRPLLRPPTIAPRLWRDRPPGMTPTQFIRAYYAPWIEFGVLTRKSIEDCDPALANAYSKRKSDYPDEAIPLARAVHPRTIADPQEAAQHYRAKGRERTARHRNRDKIAHEPK